MTEFVRVRVENGSHVTVSRGFAESHGLKPLKQPALGRDGRPLPAKHKTTDAKKASSGEESNPSGSNTAATDKEETK